MVYANQIDRKQAKSITYSLQLFRYEPNEPEEYGINLYKMKDGQESQIKIVCDLFWKMHRTNSVI